MNKFFQCEIKIGSEWKRTGPIYNSEQAAVCYIKTGFPVSWERQQNDKKAQKTLRIAQWQSK